MQRNRCATSDQRGPWRSLSGWAIVWGITIRKTNPDSPLSTPAARLPYRRDFRKGKGSSLEKGRRGTAPSALPHSTPALGPQLPTDFPDEPGNYEPENTVNSSITSSQLLYPPYVRYSYAPKSTIEDAVQFGVAGV